MLEGETGVQLVPIGKANMSPNLLDERMGLRRYRKKIETVNSQLEAWGCSGYGRGRMKDSCARSGRRSSRSFV